MIIQYNIFFELEIFVRSYVIRIENKKYKKRKKTNAEKTRVF